MKKPDTILDEIHTTRRTLYEATKEMTTSERTVYFNQAGEAAAKKYGLYRVVRAKKAGSTQGYE
jgi:flavoprotein